ncbi:hypothetical protein JGU66_11540 [Myxococcaceae bacterium JPH2]|nr:hypothetical protein [Myxococcaceae bacterium JPH2]
MMPSPPVILHVNDDPASRASTARLLERAGFEVLASDVHGESLTRLAVDVDLVLVETRAPRSEARETCQGLRRASRTHGAWVLWVGDAEAPSGAEPAGSEWGPDCWRLAPVDAGGLLSQVTLLLRLRRAEREARELSEQVSHQQHLLELAMVAPPTRESGAEEFLEQFLGMLGHDLRNPLNALSMSAQQLQRRGTLDERQAMLTGRILSSAGRMDRMIRQLLDFARARLGGGMPVLRERCDLFEVVRCTVEALRASHPDRAVELELQGDGRGAWDADRLEQVITHLVANALRYSPVESRVRVLAEGKDSEAVLCVHNQGPGIAPMDLPRLFGVWRQAGRAPREKGAPTGLGVGLYITRQIITAHGGSVEVASSADSGTTFTVHLPRN